MSLSFAVNEIASSSSATPLVRFGGGSLLWLKDETQQVSGAFKFRGAHAKLQTLDPARSIATASTGNHGIAVANAAFRLGRKAHVFLPVGAPEIKIRMVTDFGATVTLIGDNLDASTLAARAWAEEHAAIWFSGFDDETVIQGYRSLFREIAEAGIKVDRMLVPVGGGGLLAAALLEVDPSVEVIGVQSTASQSLGQSLSVGHPVRIQPGKTIATGLAVPTVGLIPYKTCFRHKPRLMDVSDDEIRSAMKALWQQNGICAEPAGAAAVAAALRLDESQCVSLCIVSGGNIARNEHQAFIS